MEILGLILTLATGIFFILGKKILKNQSHGFATAIAFTVMLGLIIFDLIPELMENYNYKILIFILIGFISFKIFDLFLPHHHHKHQKNCENKVDHKDNLMHLSIITIIALSIHNLVEGISLYNLFLYNFKDGIMLFIGIALHNLPFGLYIKDNKNMILKFILIFSAFLGGLLSFTWGNISEDILMLFLALTLGIMLYIVFFELLKELYQKRKKSEIYYGIIVGILIMLIIKIL